MIQQGGD